MTLFGRTLDAQEITALAFMLAALVYWIFVYRGERGWERWIRGWEGDRKARRETERMPPSSSDIRRGPWD